MGGAEVGERTPGRPKDKRDHWLLTRGCQGTNLVTRDLGIRETG